MRTKTEAEAATTVATLTSRARSSRRGTLVDGWCSRLTVWGSLEILRMKKRWAKKEAALREDMRKKRDKEVKSKDKQKVEQIFSTQAASGVLTNDLLSIMEQSESLGFRATPIDDNIYHWNVHLFKFQADTDLGRQLKELKKLYGYVRLTLPSSSSSSPPVALASNGRHRTTSSWRSTSRSTCTRSIRRR